ncbi:MAG TPA: hypothetical protein PKM35_08205 [Holophaga sp.]|nr:hypothetical protein [Holophaga sp.]HPS67634.1 hypothetical protein [Holophaga sp.]
MLVSVKEIRGGNLDIDLIPKPGLDWEVGRCPWNEAEHSSTHRCAVKDTSICPYFQGVKRLDIVLCSYPGEA